MTRSDVSDTLHDAAFAVAMVTVGLALGLYHFRRRNARRGIKSSFKFGVRFKIHARA